MPRHGMRDPASTFSQVLLKISRNSCTYTAGQSLTWLYRQENRAYHTKYLLPYKSTSAKREIGDSTLYALFDIHWLTTNDFIFIYGVAIDYCIK